MVNIRRCRKTDLDDLREVCRRTSSIPVGKAAQRAFLYNMYCDYYVERETEYCFAAVDERNRPIGYILCAPDYTRYRAEFLKTYVKRMALACPLKVPMAFGGILMQKPFAAEYPAHLHIDILDGWQRKGIGHRLMDALLACLKQQGVPGVMLGVGASNEKGLSFYEKYGFQVLSRAPGSVVMGRKLL